MVIPSVILHCIKENISCGQGVLAILFVDEFVDDEEKVYL